MASLYNITSRADLDSIKGTAEHDQFMQLLRGTLFNVSKNDESGAWESEENNQSIEEFGFSRKDFEPIDPPILPEYIAPNPPDLKMVGVKFEGVMCSATGDDAVGLLQIEASIRLAGDALSPMHFSNGTVHFIGKDNYQSFMSVWVPFRSSFFKDSK